MAAVILDFVAYREKKLEAEKNRLYRESIRSILKLTEHLTIKNPKEGSDDKEKNPRPDG